MLNEWLVFSLMLLGIWAAIYFMNRSSRKEMLWASILTAPLGLTEPIFVPEYWAPPSLFDLAARTGFDIESVIFSFAVGGIAAVLYEAFIKVRHEKISHAEMHSGRHRFHMLALLSGPIAFVPLLLFADINPIYSAAVAMLTGSAAAVLCRPDLKKKMLMGGIMFLGLYFVFFFSFIAAYPGIVGRVWNLSAISGILIAGVPIEELMFALTFGMLWSSYYEHINWYRIKVKR